MLDNTVRLENGNTSIVIDSYVGRASYSVPTFTLKIWKNGVYTRLSFLCEDYARSILKENGFTHAECQRALA